LNVLTPLKERGAYDTVSISIDNDLDNLSFKQKMINAIYQSSNELSVLVDDAKLCVVTCEAADVFSSQAAITLVQKAKEKGALTICLVNLPFSFEGNKRLKRAEKTVGVLKEIADTVIVIPSDPIMELIPKDTSIEKAYSMIDDVVSKGVAGIIGLVGKQGLINANFKDIETIQKGAGIGSMGLGSSSGKNAAKEAALAAVSSPLLGETIDSARSIVLSVSGGKNMSLSDVRSVVNVVYKCVDESTDVAVSAFVDENLDDEISVTLFAMGRESTSEHSNIVGEALCMEHDSETQDQDASGISSIQNKNVSEQEPSVPHVTPTNKLLPMTAEEILSLDRHANYSTSIIHPYMSIESKLKLKGIDTKTTPRAVANNLFGAKESPQEVKRRSLNHSKAVADSLFIPKTSNVRNSGLFSGGVTQRTTKLNLLQFSILEKSLSSSTSSTSSTTHHVGLFGKPTTHHKNYVRFAVRKRTPLSHMHLLLQMLDKTIKQYLL
jgi:cell division GTPase FtsZ